MCLTGSITQPHFKSAHAQTMTLTGAGHGAPGGGGLAGWCGLIPAQANLVNCWPFDTAHSTFNGSGSGNATDLKGGYNAALTNVAAGGSGPSTNLNNSGVFDGSTSFGATTLANVPTSAFTLNIWMYFNTGTGGNKRFMANCHTDSDSNGFEFETNGTGAYILVFGNGITNVTASAGADGEPVSNTWGMETVTYDGTTITPYFNGSSAADVPAVLAGPLTSCSSNVAFGYNPAYAGDYFPGREAGVAIWNTVLTSGQISTLYGL